MAPWSEPPGPCPPLKSRRTSHVLLIRFRATESLIIPAPHWFNDAHQPVASPQTQLHHCGGFMRVAAPMRPCTGPKRKIHVTLLTSQSCSSHLDPRLLQQVQTFLVVPQDRKHTAQGPIVHKVQCIQHKSHNTQALVFTCDPSNDLQPVNIAAKCPFSRTVCSPLELSAPNSIKTTYITCTT